MSRPRRVHIPGGLFHVTLRGNHREALFSIGSDRDVLIGMLRDGVVRHSARVHAFCLMTNHIHLLVQSGEAPLGTMVSWVAAKYSRFRHKQLCQSGHLFERRFFSRLVDDDAYLMQLLRYIHLNPVEAGLVLDPSEHRWSSHRAYLGEETIDWLTTETALRPFGDDMERARAGYRAFIEGFLKTRTTDEEAPLVHLAQRICARHGVEIELLRSSTRQSALAAARSEFVAAAIEDGIGDTDAIATFLRREPKAVTSLLAQRRGQLAS